MLCCEPLDFVEHILLVCHSLGGQLVKELLKYDDQLGRGPRGPQSIRLTCNTRGVLFYGVPHIVSIFSFAICRRIQR